MKAILFADRLGTELYPLTNTCSLALLPIAAKPLIEFCFESLLVAGIRNITLIISPFADSVKYYVGNGERWGMNVDYIISEGEARPSEILQQHLDKFGNHEYLCLRADILVSYLLNDFISDAKNHEFSDVYAQINGVFAGVCYIKNIQKHTQACDSLCWSTEGLATVEAEKSIAITGNFTLLNSLTTYHQANIDLLAGCYPHTILAGQRISPHLWVGRRSYINKTMHGLVGNFCRIHHSAQLAEYVVIGHDCIIDKQVKLDQCVVLPDSYVGEAVELKNAIVMGNILINIDKNTVEWINDNAVLANLTQQNFSRFFSHTLQRIGALCLAIIALPLWGIAGIISFKNNPVNPLRTISLYSNDYHIDEFGQLRPYTFTAFEWQTTVPILRHLPKLWAVITGKLTLIGIAPKSATNTNNDTPQYLPSTSYGLLGAQQLLSLEAKLSQEKIQQLESHYAHTHYIGSDIIWLVKGIKLLFCKKTWGFK